MSEFEKLLSKAVKPEFTNQRPGKRPRVKDIVMCSDVSYGYNDEILPIDFPLDDLEIVDSKDEVTVRQCKLNCSMLKEDEECDMCLEYKPVIDFYDIRDEGSYSTLICTDCLEKLIKLRKAL